MHTIYVLEQKIRKIGITLFTPVLIYKSGVQGDIHYTGHVSVMEYTFPVYKVHQSYVSHILLVKVSLIQCTSERISKMSRDARKPVFGVSDQTLII